MRRAHIDDLTSRLSTVRSRRSLLRGAAGRALGGALVLLGSNRVVARTTTTTFPFTEAVYNTCREELVVINGKLHMQTHITDKNGRLVFKLRTWSQGVSGDSPTGARYVYHSEQGDMLNAWTETGFFVSEYRSTMKLIRLGKDRKGQTGDDLFVHMTLITETDQSTGLTTVREDHYEAECR